MLGWIRAKISRLLPRSDLGRRGERWACRLLRRQGLRVLARNVRAGRDEIDIVALHRATLVFVEVKSRKRETRAERTGLEPLDERKVRALRRACLQYARNMSHRAESCRIDVVTVEFGESGQVVEERWYPGYLSL